MAHSAFIISYNHRIVSKATNTTQDTHIKGKSLINLHPNKLLVLEGGTYELSVIY
jgi:hypothetical protein